MSTKIRITQYLIVRALSDKFKNICVVGDAQSIYAFRGANINNLEFSKDYEGVKPSVWSKIIVLLEILLKPQILLLIKIKSN
jgi:superfamily I DNA/RNA helicase